MLLTLMMIACNGKDSPNLNRLEPELELPVEEINFEEVVADSQEKVATFTIRNVGGGDLVFDSIELTDGTPAVYTLGDMPSPFELDPNDEFELTIAYVPDDTIQHLGSIKLISNDPERPEVTVNITGYGIAPIIEVEPQTLWFGDQVEPGDGAVTLNVDIEARGEGALKIYEIRFEDDSYTEVFDIIKSDIFDGMSDAEPLKVPAGSSVNFQVEFEPVDGTAYDGRILIRSNDPTTTTADVRVLANTDYTGEEPPTVQILTPDWGTYFMEDEEVLLEGSIIDDADSPQSMTGSWYTTTEAEGRRYLDNSRIKEDGSTSVLAVLPVGVPVTLELEANDSQGNTGKDSIDVTVWEEEEPVPYTISGGGTVFDYWSVDDDITIYLDGVPIFSDTDHTRSSHPPIEFEALKGQEIRIVVNDVNACDVAIDALTLHWGTGLSQSLNDYKCDSSCDTHACYDGTYNGPWPNVYLDETYTIDIP